MPRPRATPGHIKRAKKWIREHPDATLTETILATKISQGSISNLRRELVAEGKLKPYAHTPSRSRAPEAPEDAPRTPTPPNSTSEDMDREIREAEDVIEARLPMTREERQRRLEELFRTGSPDHAIRANNELEKMNRASQTTDEGGPPAPLHLEDAISDVADMIEALAAWGGEEAVRQATTTGLARFFDEAPKAPVQGNEPTEEPTHA